MIPSAERGEGWKVDEAKGEHSPATVRWPDSEKDMTGGDGGVVRADTLGDGFSQWF